MRLIDGNALQIEMMDRGVDHIQTDDLAEINQIIDDAPTVATIPSFKDRREKNRATIMVATLLSPISQYMNEGDAELVKKVIEILNECETEE